MSEFDQQQQNTGWTRGIREAFQALGATPGLEARAKTKYEQALEARNLQHARFEKVAAEAGIAQGKLKGRNDYANIPGLSPQELAVVLGDLGGNFNQYQHGAQQELRNKATQTNLDKVMAGGAPTDDAGVNVFDFLQAIGAGSQVGVNNFNVPTQVSKKGDVQDAQAGNFNASARQHDAAAGAQDAIAALRNAQKDNVGALNESTIAARQAQADAAAGRAEIYGRKNNPGDYIHGPTHTASYFDANGKPLAAPVITTVPADALPPATVATPPAAAAVVPPNDPRVAMLRARAASGDLKAAAYLKAKGL